MHLSTSRIDEFINRQDIVPARLEPFGTATHDFATPCLQSGLDSLFKSAALVCPDLDKKNRLIRRTGIYLLRNPIHAIQVGGSNLYPILTTAIPLGINDAGSVTPFFNI